MSTLAIRPICPELQVVAKEQLNEDPEKIQEFVEMFRAWIKKSPHLKARTDDQFLVNFLRGCKFNMERSKQKFDMFYTTRFHFPDIIKGRDPFDQKISSLVKLGAALPLPNLEHPGAPRLFLFRMGAYDADKVPLMDIMKISSILNDIMLQEDDNMIIAGQIGVCDLKGVGVSHFTQMTPSLMKKMTVMMQEASPIRPKGFHYINAPKAFEQFFNLFKTFMNEKMKTRLHVHASFDSLYKVIPRSLMPTEYEGEAGSMQSLTDEWEKKINSYRDYLLEEESLGVDEKKRPGRPKDPDSLFGIDGTFRKLNLVFGLRLFNMSTLVIRPICHELQVVAKEQLNEDPEKTQEFVEMFRAWIKKSPHLKGRTDDQFLLNFLRGSKFNMERVKQKYDMFYTTRFHFPDMLRGRDPLDQNIRSIIKLGVGLPLPKLQHPGAPRVTLVRMGAYDADKLSIIEVMRVSMMVNDIMLQEDDNMVIAGQIGIMDLKGVGMSHFTQMGPALMKKMTMMMQEASPIRQKGFHYINAPKIFEQFFNLFKTFMNEKMKSRLYVHATLDSLYEVIPRSLMPTEYEGEAGSLESLTEQWEEKIISYRDYLLEEESLGVDEKKRPGRPKDPDSLFGIDGTFRKLNVD